MTLFVIPAKACLSGRQAGIQEIAVETCNINLIGGAFAISGFNGHE